MIIHTHSQIGQFHTNHNEDAYVTTQLSNDWYLLGVMDGCSMGTESHFASTLLVKLLRKISTEYFYKAFVWNDVIPQQKSYLHGYSPNTDAKPTSLDRQRHQNGEV